MNFSLFYLKNNNYERFFKEILVYQFQMNEKIIEIFENNPDKISEKAHLLFLILLILIIFGMLEFLEKLLNLVFGN
jgi:hypothetical protein